MQQKRDILGRFLWVVTLLITSGQSKGERHTFETASHYSEGHEAVRPWYGVSYKVVSVRPAIG